MRDKYGLIKFSIIICLAFGQVCWAVTSDITRHNTGTDLLKGEVDGVVVSSEGTIGLGRAAQTLAEKFGAPLDESCEKDTEEVWSINSIVVSGGNIFVGTSPNGGVYKYSLGGLTRIYPVESEQQSQDEQEESIEIESEPNDVNSSDDANTVDIEQYLSNEHIFAMATDVAGRLLVGVSGESCKLYRFEAGQMEVVFEPNEKDVKYIFAIAVDDGGDIYLGTGPEGRVYRLNPFGKESQLIYDSIDKNILSLEVGEDGFIYAGSDDRGLVYKINSTTKTATVLYDSQEEEITALLMENKSKQKDGESKAALYAAATSAKVVSAETKFSARSQAGRPEVKLKKGKSSKQTDSSVKLKVANTRKRAVGKEAGRPRPAAKPRKPGRASYIYKITGAGFVTEEFSRDVVLFCLAQQGGELLVGSGNKAQLFAINPAAEREKEIYADQQASQITALAVDGDQVYVGTANPAKLIKLDKNFAAKGTYTSQLIDAGQPARWGKLQIEAEIPLGCKVLVSSRTGNVEDVNDPTFSEWAEAVEVTGPVQLQSPIGRFCQYKLILLSEDGIQSPLIREAAVAHTIPNLAPQVESVEVSRIGAPGKEGIFKIAYKAKDDNKDQLIYKIDFRKTGRSVWIELEDDVEADNFEWDGKTVEDGRYEIRVIASDERSNTEAAKLTGSRISEIVVVDNTGPVIKRSDLAVVNTAVVLKLEVEDQLSVIGAVYYTVDSNAKWTAVVPDDMVYDTTNEEFTIVTEELKNGEHIVSVKVTDDVGNTTYKTFDVNPVSQ